MFFKTIEMISFEVIALDDGIFPRSIVKKLAVNYVMKLKLTAVIYLRWCKITCLTLLILSLLFKTRTYQNKCNFVQSSAWEIVTSSHATRLTWGCKMAFSASEVDAEILVPYAKIYVYKMTVFNKKQLIH